MIEGIWILEGLISRANRERDIYSIRKVYPGPPDNNRFEGHADPSQFNIPTIPFNRLPE